MGRKTSGGSGKGSSQRNKNKPPKKVK